MQRTEDGRYVIPEGKESLIDGLLIGAAIAIFALLFGPGYL